MFSSCRVHSKLELTQQNNTGQESIQHKKQTGYRGRGHQGLGVSKHSKGSSDNRSQGRRGAHHRALLSRSGSGLKSCVVIEAAVGPRSDGMSRPFAGNISAFSGCRFQLQTVATPLEGHRPALPPVSRESSVLTRCQDCYGFSFNCNFPSCGEPAPSHFPLLEGGWIGRQATLL